jgi:hypothetical protein
MGCAALRGAETPQLLARFRRPPSCPHVSHTVYVLVCGQKLHVDSLRSVTFLKDASAVACQQRYILDYPIPPPGLMIEFLPKRM